MSDGSMAPKGEKRQKESKGKEVGPRRRGAQNSTFPVAIGTYLERRCLPSLALGQKEASSLPKSLAQASHKHRSFGQREIPGPIESHILLKPNEVKERSLWENLTHIHKDWVRLPGGRQRIGL